MHSQFKDCGDSRNMAGGWFVLGGAGSEGIQPHERKVIFPAKWRGGEGGKHTVVKRPPPCVYGLLRSGVGIR